MTKTKSQSQINAEKAFAAANLKEIRQLMYNAQQTAEDEWQKVYRKGENKNIEEVLAAADKKETEIRYSFFRVLGYLEAKIESLED